MSVFSDECTLMFRMSQNVSHDDSGDDSAHQDDDKRYNPDVITVTISMIFQITFKMIRN